MSKRSLFRTPFGSQRVNGSQSMLRSARNHFYTTIPLISKKMCWEKLLLVRSEISGLFPSTLTTDDKYSRQTRENFRQHIQMQISKKPKKFSAFSITFLNLHQILSILKKKKKKTKKTSIVL